MSRIGVYLCAIFALALLFTFLVIPKIGHWTIQVHLPDPHTEPASVPYIKEETVNIIDLGGGDAKADPGFPPQGEDRQPLLVDASRYHPTSFFNASLAFALKQPLLPVATLQLLSGSVMPLFVPPPELEALAQKLR